MLLLSFAEFDNMLEVYFLKFNLNFLKELLNMSTTNL